MTNAARRARCLVALAIVGTIPGIGNRVSAAGQVSLPGEAPPGETARRKASIAAQGVTMLLLEPPAGEAGKDAKATSEQGVLTLFLEPSTILSWPSRFSRSTSFVFKGKRTMLVSLLRCVDEECNTTEPISNVLSADVEFR